MSHKGNMALYSGIKTSLDLSKAIDEFEDRHGHPPIRILVNTGASHLPETIGVSDGIREVELGTKALTPPNEHVFLFLREATINESPFSTDPYTD